MGTDELTYVPYITNGEPTVLQTKRVDSENFEFRGYNHFTISK